MQSAFLFIQSTSLHWSSDGNLSFATWVVQINISEQFNGFIAAPQPFGKKSGTLPSGQLEFDDIIHIYCNSVSGC